MSMLSRLLSLFRQDKLDRALEEEMRTHIEMRTEANIAAGMSALEAKADAVRRFGNRAVTKEEMRSFDLVNWVDVFIRDVRFGLRTLRRTPTFTMVAIVTLALGIGANTAMFSVIYTVMFKSLPYPEADRLVIFQSTHVDRTPNMFRLSEPDYRDWEKQVRSFSQMAMGSYWSNNITGIENPERVVGFAVTGQFFPLLGVPAMLGRTLTPEDDRAGATPVAVLSFALWKRLFGGREDVVGRTIVLNGTPTTVVGVMPAEFAFPVQDAALWISIGDAMQGVPRNSRFVMAVGRLAPGVGLMQAQAEMDSISRNLEREYPDSNKGWGVVVTPANEAMVGDMRSKLLLLMCSIAAVLLIACSNVASLLLARMLNRQRELAVRAALGASRWRLVAQSVTENLVLSGIGTLLGLGIAKPLLEYLKRAYPADIPHLQEATLSVPVLFFAAGIMVLVALFLGVIAGLRSSRVDPLHDLKAGTPTSSATRSQGGVRNALVITEVAFAGVLLIGGGLLIRSLQRVMNVDPGFRVSNVLTFNCWLVGGKYRQAAAQSEFVQNSIERIGDLPGVESVGAITQVPLAQGGRTTVKFQPVDRSISLADSPWAAYRAISPGYFSTMGISLVAGRPFSEADKDGAPRVIIVNQRLANAIWPGQDAIGKRLHWSESQYDVGPLTVVGVAADVRARELEMEDEPAVYIPYPQRTLPFLRWVAIAVRTKADPMPMWPEIRKQVLALDADRVIYNVKTTRMLVDESVAERRFNAFLLGTFAALALLLAATGIYGLISYSVSRRGRESAFAWLSAQRAEM